MLEIFCRFEKHYNMASNKPTLERQIITYVKPHYYKLFIADCRGSVSGKSDHCRQIIKQFYDNMSQQQRNALIKLYDEMTPEERLNPRMI
jgi:hypothetical protein